MAGSVTVGLMSFPDSWSTATLHAQWAEEAGCSSLWTGDHLRHPRNPEEGFLDGWSLLPAWAAVTTRVEIGMLVSNLIYRNPALLARQAATVDVIAGGRHILGIGTGVYESDHAMAGVEPWSPPERVGRLGACLAIVDRLLRGETVTVDGPYYTTRDAVVRPRPIREPRPPLLVGALGPKTIALAVQYADTWNTFAGFASNQDDAIDAVRQQCAIVDRTCAQLGRDPASLRRSLLLYPPFEPLATKHELERIVAIFLTMGITEFVVYAPTNDKQPILLDAVRAVTGPV